MTLSDTEKTFFAYGSGVEDSRASISYSVSGHQSLFKVKMP
jgi:hypothetical protein